MLSYEFCCTYSFVIPRNESMYSKCNTFIGGMAAYERKWGGKQGEVKDRPNALQGYQ